MERSLRDDLIPMAVLPFDEQTLAALLSRWLPPVVGPTGAQLLALARAPEQESLEEEEATADG